MGWPNEKAVGLAERRLRKLDETCHLEDMDTASIAREALEAAGLPELVGSTDTAKILGVESSNLSRVAGLPAPLYELRGGRLYDAEEIRALAARRKAAA